MAEVTLFAGQLKDTLSPAAFQKLELAFRRKEPTPDQTLSEVMYNAGIKKVLTYIEENMVSHG